MITDLKILDDDTASAIGEKYDLGKVLSAAEAFLRGFAAHVILASPGARATVRIDYGDEFPFNDAGQARLRNFHRGLAARHDVIMAGAAIVVGPFRLSLRLLGDDDLFLKEGDIEPTTVSGGRWSTLETAPGIIVMPADGSSPLFETGAAAAVHALVRSYAPRGTDASGISHLPGIRFPHASFGAGWGLLRIALTRVPAESYDPVEP